MSKTTEDLVAQVTGAFSDRARAAIEELEFQGLIRGARDLTTALHAADAAADVVRQFYVHEATGTTELGARIGPVYSLKELTRWLTPPTADDLSEEAVRKRTRQRRLVAFRTDDRQWAYPAWQFDRAGGQLHPRGRVTALWQILPHAGYLTDADLVAWMNTRMTSLEGTPAERAHRYGPDDEPLRHAVARLTARAA